MNGVYEDAMQIKTGHFSYFVSMFGFERSGRIVNALYGSILNYLLGALLLLCGSWIRFEFTLFFVTLVICGCGVYACTRQLRIQKSAMLYMISRPVMLVWIGNFMFTGLGSTVLLPFVILAGIKIVQQHQIHVIPLALLVAVCLQIHLMTSLIAVMALIPFALCGLALSSRRGNFIIRGVSPSLLSV